MTAWVTVSPRYASASLLSLPRIRAEISWALYFLPSMSTVQSVPMCRLTERMVRSGLVMAWRLATSPTSTSPDLANPTTDGVVRPPSALGMTTGSPASRTLTTELVVPRSIPTALGMGISSVVLLPGVSHLGFYGLWAVLDCGQYSELESWSVNFWPIWPIFPGH